MILSGFLGAERHARKVLSVVKSIEDSIRVGKNLAYVQINSELPSSMVVNFFGMENQLHLYTRRDINSIISIRGSNECKVHLGRIVNNLSSTLGVEEVMRNLRRL